jgi:protein ImuB
MPRPSSGATAEEPAFATVATSGGRRLLAAVNPAAAAAGLMSGMPLADALSFLPGLITVPAEPAADAAALTRLAEWCGRYSPWTAPDGADGVKIEITGSTHLWGGEAMLAADLARRLTRQRIDHRIAIAGTLGAAWALARFAAGQGRPALPAPADQRDALAPLPVEALRLDPVIAAGLRRVGLRRIGELLPMPRDALARRFGDGIARRLDQMSGGWPEPLSPLGETPARRVRLSFAEPIADPADLACAAERLAGDLVPRLAREGMGARRLDLAFYRIDGRVEHIGLGTARPSRDAHHLAGLFASKLDIVDPGFGIEDMILAAFAVEPLEPEQIALAARLGSAGAGGIAPLLDRLGARLGLGALSRIEARASHIPERASVNVSVGKSADSRDSKRRRSTSPSLPPGAERAGVRWGIPERLPTPTSPSHRFAMGPSLSPLKGGEGFSGSDAVKPPRPIRLLQPPQPIEAFWVLPDDPPFHFTWRRCRHRVVQAEGPERIAAEWWNAGGSFESGDDIRDYYRVEDEAGRRFWLFRAGPSDATPPRWFMHGVFA